MTLPFKDITIVSMNTSHRNPRINPETLSQRWGIGLEMAKQTFARQWHNYLLMIHSSHLSTRQCQGDNAWQVHGIVQWLLHLMHPNRTLLSMAKQDRKKYMGAQKSYTEKDESQKCTLKTMGLLLQMVLQCLFQDIKQQLYTWGEYTLWSSDW